MLEKRKRVRKWQSGGFNALFSAAGLSQNGTSTIVPQPPKAPIDFGSQTKGIFSKANIGNTMNIAGQAANILSSFLPQKHEYSGDRGGLTAGLDAGYDAVASAAGAIPGVGSLVSGAMQVGKFVGNGLNAITGGTDGMTGGDAFLGSTFGTTLAMPFSIINSAFGKKADTIYKDNETWESQGSAYGGSMAKVDDALTKSGKKYGAFSNKARKKANRQIAEAKRQQNAVSDINEEARDAFQSQAGSIDRLNRRNALSMAGGYQSRGMRIGRVGVKLPTQEEIARVREFLASRTKKFAEGGKMNVIINSDVYNIAKRIKDIDRDYFIVYNTSKNVYEVHNSSQIGSTYCVCIPYNTLDVRTLEFVYMTQSKFISDIIAKIDSENKLKENAEKSRVFLTLNETITDTFKK